MSHIFSSIVFHFFFDIDEGILESIMVVNYRLFSYKRGPSWKEVQGNTYWSSEDGWVIHTNINKFQWLIDTCVMYIVQCTSLFCSGFCCASKGHKMKFKLKKVVIFITFQSQSCFYSWLFSNTGATKNTSHKYSLFIASTLVSTFQFLLGIVFSYETYVLHSEAIFT